MKEATKHRPTSVAYLAYRRIYLVAANPWDQLSSTVDRVTLKGTSVVQAIRLVQGYELKQTRVMIFVPEISNLGE